LRSWERRREGDDGDGKQDEVHREEGVGEHFEDVVESGREMDRSKDSCDGMESPAEMERWRRIDS